MYGQTKGRNNVKFRSMVTREWDQSEETHRALKAMVVSYFLS